MNVVIGVDAGGTKTSAAAYDELGRELARHRTGAGNFSMDPAEAGRHVVEAVEHCLHTCGGECKGILVGAAGMRGFTGREALAHAWEERFSCPVILTDDGALALWAALGARDGLLVISGTGSIAYGRKGTEVCSRGGWGQVLDDRGSGYAIVVEAFRRMTEDYDDGSPLSALSAVLLEHFEIGGVTEAAALLNRSGKGEIAAALPLVELAAQQGDAVAAKLLTAAGEQLAELAAALCARLKITAPLIAVSGSVLLKTPLVRERFWEVASARIPGVTPVCFDASPEIAAFHRFYSPAAHQ